MYYGRLTNGFILNTYENTGTAASQNNYTFFGTTTGHPTLPGIASIAPALTPNIQYFDKNFQLPQVHQFDLAVQRDMGHGTMVSISYLGALSRQLPNYINLNIDPSQRYTDTVTVTADPTAGGKCGPIACGTTITTQVYSNAKTVKNVKTSTLLNPQYNAVTDVVSNINANYNAMVAEVQSRSIKWVQFDANYTFSHALDFNQNQSTSASTNGFYDPFASDQYKVNYANSNYNVPNRFVGWALFSSPSLANDWKKYLLNQWSLNPIFAYQNGLPYSYSISGSAPNITGTSTVTGYTHFSSGPIGTGVGFLPQLGRNTLRQPSTAVVDLRTQKQITFKEKYNLQLIGEAFNLMNHQNITGINSTSYTYNGSSMVWGYTGNVFGQKTNANSNYAYSTRQIQLSVRLEF